MQEKFSKRMAYDNNIAAIRELIKGDQANVEVLKDFQGFGAMKELLLDLDNIADWNKTDLSFKEDVEELHDVLKDLFGAKYKEVISSIKNSVLSSFYTPGHIINPIVDSLRAFIPEPETVLEPSAGSGRFVNKIRDVYPDAKITAVEKDLATAAVLKSLAKGTEVINSGLEDFRNRKFDLVISNIPFGTIPVYDDQMYRESVPVKIKSTTRIHNYFFVKGLDNLKEGGVLAFVTSAGVMDSPGNREIREYLMKTADLVSAVRLPNNVFESAGTYPMTDIIILRKNSKKKALSPKEREFTTSVKIELKNEAGVNTSVDINQYFTVHKKAVLGRLVIGGQYGREALDCESSMDEYNLAGELRSLLESDIRNGMQEGVRITSAVREGDSLETDGRIAIPERYPNRDILKPGNLVVVKGQVGQVVLQDDGLFFEALAFIKDVERVAALLPIRDNLNLLVEAELAGDQEKMQLLRRELNVSYDQFVFQYSNLFATHNKKLLQFESEGFKVHSLERLLNGKYVKADIFEKQINNVERRSPESLSSLEDSILLSLNSFNRIDVSYIADLTGRTEDQALKEGIDKDLIFLQADANGDFKFVPRDEFLSGNIVEKIEKLSEAKRFPKVFSEENKSRHLQLLNEVRPVLLSRELIDINFGVRWVPIDVYESFATELFKVPVTIKYMSAMGQYLVTLSETSRESNITYAAVTNAGSMSGRQLMEYAMLDTNPRLSILIEKGPPPVYKPDVDGMKNAELRIKEIKAEFQKYTTENKKVAQRLEEIYNRKINNYVHRVFDGSHLKFDSLSHFTPKSYQADGVWKLVQDDGGLMANVVGSGKSLSIALTATKMKQLGMSNKPLILCLKANVGAVAKEFQKAFPNAKVLAPSEADFTKQKRKTIFASIATNDWDAVILTHDNFLKIPQNPHMVKKVISEELENLESDLAVVKGNAALSKRVLKGLEKRKESLKTKIKQHEASIDRDHYIMNFDTMGFDHLFIDESQEFKNLPYTTRQQEVSGLGSPEGSAKALNLLYAVRTIQEKKGGDKGITFCTGTPISNSLVELYLLKKYLRPNKLRESGINSFDAWALMFAKKSTTYEFSVTNELKLKERYREFINLPELKMWYSELAHVVTKSDLGAATPKIENCLVNIDPTADQVDYIERLVQFTKTKNAAYIGRERLTEGEESAFMLLATNLAKKMSLDMRLISTAYKEDVKSKIGVVCQCVTQEYNESTDFKGTQLIFSDIGTPGGAGFDLYAALKTNLVRNGIPAEEIAFIHDYDTKGKKQKLQDLVNAGEIRVVIGSTKKLGTGNNIQNRLVALHDLDIPWRPSDMEQRGGRLERQGAWACKEYRNNIGKRYIYATNRTLDSYQFNILSNKQKFIDQVTNAGAKVVSRRIDEGSLDQDGAMNFSEYVALLSGNTDLLEKAKLEKKLADVERTYQAFTSSKMNATSQIRILNKTILSQKSTLERLSKDHEIIKDLDLENSLIEVGSRKLEDRKAVGEALLSRLSEIKQRGVMKSSETFELASLHGFKLSANQPFPGSPIKCYVTGPSGSYYDYAEGVLNSSPALAGRFIIDAIKRLPKMVAHSEERIKDWTEEIKMYEKLSKEEFPHLAEIESLKKEIEVIHYRIESEAIKADQKVQAVDQAPEEKVSEPVKRKVRMKM